MRRFRPFGPCYVGSTVKGTSTMTDPLANAGDGAGPAEKEVHIRIVDLDAYESNDAEIL